MFFISFSSVTLCLCGYLLCRDSAPLTGEDARPSTSSCPTRTGVSRATLFRFEVGWSLLHICCQTFLRVFALEEQLLVLAFDCERRLQRNLPSRLDGALDSAYGLSSLVGRGELARVLQNVFYEAIALKDVVDDPEFLRLLE